MNKKLLLSIRSLVMLFCCPFLLIIFFACSYFYQTGKNQIATLIDNNATAIITQTRDDIEQKVSYAVSLPSKITTSSYYYKMRNNIYNGKDVFSANDYYNFSTSIYNFLSMNANYIDSILFYLDDHSITLYRSNSSALLKDIYYDFDSYEQIYKPYNMYWITNKSTLYPYMSWYN